MKKIIFVCTGNTCRSPMAEGIAKKIAKDLDNPVEIYSRGVSAAEKEPANELAIEALLVYQIDIKEHRSKQIGIEDFNEETIVLAMTQQHRKILTNNFPKFAEKVYTIKEFAGLTGEIRDPFGESLLEYQNCAQELKQLIEMIFSSNNKELIEQ